MEIIHLHLLAMSFLDQSKTRKDLMLNIEEEGLP